MVQAMVAIAKHISPLELPEREGEQSIGTNASGPPPSPVILHVRLIAALTPEQSPCRANLGTGAHGSPATLDTCVIAVQDRTV